MEKVVRKKKLISYFLHRDFFVSKKKKLFFELKN